MVRLALHSIAYEAKTLNLAKEGFTTYYVDGTDGLDSRDGGSWAQAFKTIQNAIDESESWAKIFIKAGTYAESLTIPQDGMSLIGERTSSVIIDPATSGNIISSTANNLRLESLTAIGDGAGTDNSTIALSGDYAHLSKIEVGNRTSTGIGINPETGNHCIIDQATIYQTHPGGVGIRIGGNYNIVKNCVLDNVDYYGIHLLTAEWCRIYENTISNAGSYVFYATSFSETNTVFHNNFMGTMKDDSGGKVNYFENYYPDHTTDANNDGMADTSRTQNGATDYQPVSRKNGWKQGSLGMAAGGASAKQDTIISGQEGGVNDVNRSIGNLQMAATTIDLNQAAATYTLLTGTTQAVVLEKLAFRLPNVDISGGSLTSILIQTDDATPAVIISASDGVLANLTQEASLAWTGSLLIPAGTLIQLTIAGGAAGTACSCDVVAESRSVVNLGHLA